MQTVIILSDRHQKNSTCHSFGALIFLKYLEPFVILLARPSGIQNTQTYENNRNFPLK